MADFSELLEQQKKTNQLLQKQIADDEEGDNLRASIKNAAGEIATEVLIHKTEEGKGKLKVDDILEDEFKTGSTPKMLDELKAIANILEKQSTMMGTAPAGKAVDVVGDASFDEGPGVDNAKRRETAEDDAKRANKDTGLLKGIQKSLGGIAKGFGTAAKATVLSTMFAGALIWFIKFTETKQWKEMADSIAKFMNKGLPMLVSVVGSIMSALWTLGKIINTLIIQPLRIIINKIGSIFNIDELGSTVLGVVGVLGGLVAVFAPLLAWKGIKLLKKGILSAIVLGKGLMAARAAPGMIPVPAMGGAARAGTAAVAGAAAGGMWGKVKGLAGKAGRFGPLAGLAIGGMVPEMLMGSPDARQVEINRMKGAERAKSQGTRTLSHVTGGAALGGMMGMFGGPLAALSVPMGAAIGGVLGAVYSFYQWWKTEGDELSKKAKAGVNGMSDAIKGIDDAAGGVKTTAALAETMTSLLATAEKAGVTALPQKVKDVAVDTGRAARQQIRNLEQTVGAPSDKIDQLTRGIPEITIKPSAITQESGILAKDVVAKGKKDVPPTRKRTAPVSSEAMAVKFVARAYGIPVKQLLKRYMAIYSGFRDAFNEKGHQLTREGYKNRLWPIAEEMAPGMGLDDTAAPTSAAKDVDELPKDGVKKGYTADPKAQNLIIKQLQEALSRQKVLEKQIADETAPTDKKRAAFEKKFAIKDDDFTWPGFRATESTPKGWKDAAIKSGLYTEQKAGSYFGPGQTGIYDAPESTAVQEKYTELAEVQDAIELQRRRLEATIHGGITGEGSYDKDLAWSETSNRSSAKGKMRQKIRKRKRIEDTYDPIGHSDRKLLQQRALLGAGVPATAVAVGADPSGGRVLEAMFQQALVDPLLKKNLQPAYTAKSKDTMPVGATDAGGARLWADVIGESLASGKTLAYEEFNKLHKKHGDFDNTGERLDAWDAYQLELKDRKLKAAGLTEGTLVGGEVVKPAGQAYERTLSTDDAGRTVETKRGTIVHGAGSGEAIKYEFMMKMAARRDAELKRTDPEVWQARQEGKERRAERKYAEGIANERLRASQQTLGESGGFSYEAHPGLDPAIKEGRRIIEALRDPVVGPILTKHKDYQQDKVPEALWDQYLPVLEAARAIAAERAKQQTVETKREKQLAPTPAPKTPTVPAAMQPSAAQELLSARGEQEGLMVAAAAEKAKILADKAAFDKEWKMKKGEWETVGGKEGWQEAAEKSGFYSGVFKRGAARGEVRELKEGMDGPLDKIKKSKTYRAKVAGSMRVTAAEEALEEQITSFGIAGLGRVGVPKGVVEQLDFLMDKFSQLELERLDIIQEKEVTNLGQTKELSDASVKSVQDFYQKYIDEETSKRLAQVSSPSPRKDARALDQPPDAAAAMQALVNADDGPNKSLGVNIHNLKELGQTGIWSQRKGKRTKLESGVMRTDYEGGGYAISGGEGKTYFDEEGRKRAHFTPKIAGLQARTFFDTMGDRTATTMAYTERGIGKTGESSGSTVRLTARLSREAAANWAADQKGVAMPYPEVGLPGGSDWTDKDSGVFEQDKMLKYMVAEVGTDNYKSTSTIEKGVQTNAIRQMMGMGMSQKMAVAVGPKGKTRISSSLTGLSKGRMANLQKAIQLARTAMDIESGGLGASNMGAGKEQSPEALALAQTKYASALKLGGGLGLDALKKMANAQLSTAGDTINFSSMSDNISNPSNKNKQIDFFTSANKESQRLRDAALAATEAKAAAQKSSPAINTTAVAPTYNTTSNTVTGRLSSDTDDPRMWQRRINAA